ncbi:MAG TPA: hypothetical protein VM783_09800 [Candidatus Acidoferrum sp.]|nr:hypothetical protein [Candidatus Acidoferrum sp.]
MLVYAYTAPFNSNPEYINVSGADNGSTIVTVRTNGANEVSKLNLPPEECIKLGHALLARGRDILG